MSTILIWLLICAPVPEGPKFDPTGRGYLGVVVSPESLRIATIQPGTPAEKAGLLPGDDIVEMNGFKPESNTGVIEFLKALRPGAEVTMTIKRAGKPLTLKIRIMARPPEADLQVFP
jgi:S1-C subfamily serine protease